MPLYETIIIAKCNSAIKTAELFKVVSQTILKMGGNVRDVNVLGDRILSSRRKTLDGNFHLLGRYAQILYDGNPKIARAAEDIAQTSFETMKVNTFKVKDFFSEAQYYQKNLSRAHNFTSDELRNRKYMETLKKMKNTPDHEGGFYIDKEKYGMKSN